MRVFIAGATGFIGSAVARNVAAAGDQVFALARNAAAEQAVVDAAYTPVPGDLKDHAALTRAARAADAVVHVANAGGADTATVDEAATHAMVRALEGSGKAFLYTSGVWVVGDTGGSIVDEDGPVNAAALIAWRAPLEKWLKDAARRGVRTVVIRPGVVYGHGGGIPAMMARGEVPVVGSGLQRWAVVHVDDLAALYVAALRHAPAGAVLHGVGGEVTARALGEALGSHFVPLEEAIAKMGAFAEALALDQRIASQKTRDLMSWVPREPSILEAPDVAPARR